MSRLQQHLADTAADLKARLCELNELREQVRKALKSPQPNPWHGHGTISRSSPEKDRDPAFDQHWKG
jgi:hypothetical protein